MARSLPLSLLCVRSLANEVYYRLFWCCARAHFHAHFINIFRNPNTFRHRKKKKIKRVGYARRWYCYILRRLNGSLMSVTISMPINLASSTGQTAEIVTSHAALEATWIRLSRVKWGQKCDLAWFRTQNVTQPTNVSCSIRALLRSLNIISCALESG